MENSIEKQITIRASKAKVWKALTDAKQFGQWFKVELRSDFAAGKTTKGMNTSKGFEMPMEFHIKEIKPQTYFSYAWTPFPMDRKFDYSKEQPTLVEFFLEELEGATLLRVKESGFDLITASRRAEAFKMHTGGWEAQLKNIGEYVAKH
jgi:uncharacterized protein YndB with AHSA1/START domain